MLSILTEPFKYEDDVHNHWLSILLKTSASIDTDTLRGTWLHTSFTIVDKESTLPDPWRRIILRKVCKRTLGVLEFGESVLDTVEDKRDKGFNRTIGHVIQTSKHAWLQKCIVVISMMKSNSGWKRTSIDWVTKKKASTRMNIWFNDSTGQAMKKGCNQRW